MRNARIIKLGEPSRVTIVLAKSDLDEIIQCIANAADRAESASYDLSSTPRANLSYSSKLADFGAVATMLGEVQGYPASRADVRLV